MQTQDLQNKIKEFYLKLPENLQREFSSMAWMQKLEEISKKYNLKPEQQETLGIETSLALLGMIHTEELRQNLSKGLDLEENVLNKIMEEVYVEVVKDFEEDLEKTFIKNAISLEEQDIPTPPYAKSVSAEEIPIPKPEAKTPENLPAETSSEDDVFKGTGIEMVNDEPTTNTQSQENNFTIKEDKELVDSGVSVMEEKTTTEKEHLLPNQSTQKSVLEGLENPPSSTSSILGQKLGGETSQTTSSNIQATNQSPSSNDPYREEVE